MKYNLISFFIASFSLLSLSAHGSLEAVSGSGVNSTLSPHRKDPNAYSWNANLCQNGFGSRIPLDRAETICGKVINWEKVENAYHELKTRLAFNNSSISERLMRAGNRAADRITAIDRQARDDYSKAIRAGNRAADRITTLDRKIRDKYSKAIRAGNRAADRITTLDRKTRDDYSKAIRAGNRAADDF